MVAARSAEQRRNEGSDADTNIVRTQSRQGTGEIAWCRIDASSAAASVPSRPTYRVRASRYTNVTDCLC